MPRLQQEMVVRGEDVVVTSTWFMGKVVGTSKLFAYKKPKKFYRRGRNKRMIKKWLNRYGSVMVPRKDAVILSCLILCHPDTLWRFNADNFVEPKGENIGVEEHDIHL